MIKVVDLYKSFGTLEVLRGSAMKSIREKWFALSGPAGRARAPFCAASTYWKSPPAVEVFIDGVSLTEHGKDINKLRQKVGMVFQQFNLFPHMNVMENITLAPVKLKGMGVRKRPVKRR